MRSSRSTLLLLAAAGVVLLVGDCSAAHCDDDLKYTGKILTENFKADEYLGTWYQIARFGEDNAEGDGKCITTDFTLAGINNITVRNTTYTNGFFKDEISWATVDNFDAGEAKLTVHYRDGSEAAYYVLDTDYQTYSIVWVCMKTTDENTESTEIKEMSWILSRNSSLEKDQRDKVNVQVVHLHLGPFQYKDTEQNPETCIVDECYKPVVSDFDANKYLGTWYEIARFGQTDFEDGGQCITVEYTLSGINNITIRDRMYATAEETFKERVGSANVIDPNFSNGKLEVHFPGDVADYFVLDTDYEGYSIVWVCRIVNTDDEANKIVESSWILSRAAQLTEEQEQKVNDKLQELGMPRNLYKDTPQDPQQCIPNTNTCNKPALAEFEISKYLGTWYEIARFGQAPLEEGGQCITAKYVQVDVNNVTVHNRMFSKAAGAFKEITGWAELDVPDTKEAKFTVYFPSIQASAPYWVLDTDYENYSIVWSCSDSTDDMSETTGTSWILSRHPELTPEQVEQVTEKLDAKGLSWSSYETISQDTQKCVASGSAACNKPAVTEFDIYKYLGTWYEIARYGEAPMEEGGQCITAEYALVSKDNVTVHNRIFSKAARAYKDITGWAQLDDPDNGEAKFTVHFPSESVTTPYWVLDTDYANYSIVWACSESTDDTSEITETSWVLSRTRVMPVEVQQLVAAKLQELGLPGSQFTETPQDPKGCKVKGTKGGAAAAGPAVALTLITAIALLFSPW